MRLLAFSLVLMSSYTDAMELAHVQSRKVSITNSRSKDIWISYLHQRDTGIKEQLMRKIPKGETLPIWTIIDDQIHIAYCEEESTRNFYPLYTLGKRRILTVTFRDPGCWYDIEYETDNSDGSDS